MRARAGRLFAATLMSVAWPALIALAAAALPVGSASGRARPAAGQLLVASRSIVGSGFAESVVLLTRYGEDGAVGLIINRVTGMAVSRVLEGFEAAKDRSEPVWIGGPVGRTGAMALWRTERKAGPGAEVVGGVRLIVARGALEKALAARGKDEELRVYLGYAGWAAGQLERELAAGQWHLTPATAELVFEAHPETLWPRLIQRFEGLRAGLRLPANGGGTLREAEEWPSGLRRRS